jgi:hypothetical protein
MLRRGHCYQLPRRLSVVTWSCRTHDAAERDAEYRVSSLTSRRERFMKRESIPADATLLARLHRDQQPLGKLPIGAVGTG